MMVTYDTIYSMKHAYNFKDRTGEKIGRLTVIKYFGKINKKITIWKCKCSCGTTKNIRNYNLNIRHTTSCGCLHKEITSKISATHGFAKNGKSRFYKIYTGIKQRCTNPNSNRFKNYGGRGIKNEWNSFEDFKNDMYLPYKGHVEKFGIKQTSIDRINVNGNYCRENCKWATNREQMNNTRRSKK